MVADRLLGAILLQNQRFTINNLQIVHNCEHRCKWLNSKLIQFKSGAPHRIFNEIVTFAYVTGTKRTIRGGE